MRLVRLLLPGLIVAMGALGVSSAQTISIVSGNGQVACNVCFIVNPKTTFDPLVVKVVDSAGRPLPNATVNWALTTGSGSITSSQTTTDATGITSNQFNPAFIGTTFNIAFTQGIVTASIGSSSVQFTETQAINSTQQATTQPLSITFPTSTNITGPAGSSGAVTLPVTVTSTLGIAVPGVAVKLGTDDVAGGPTVSCVADPGQPAGIVMTDATGVANCKIQFGPVVGSTGTFKVIVGGGYLSSTSLPFTVTTGGPGSIGIVRGDQQTPVPGQPLAPLVAKVGDLGGNPVNGVDVDWTVIPSTAATLFNVRNQSAVDGLVSVNVTLGAASGPFQVRVSIRANPAISATFTVNAPQISISSLTKVSGDGQDAGQNSAFSAPLIVAAATNGAPVAGVAVSFTVTSGSAVLSAPSASTNAQGQAQVTVTAGPNIGPVVVTAASGAFNVTFNLTVRAPGPAFTTDSFTNAVSGLKASDPQGGISPCSLATISAASLVPGAVGLTRPSLFGPPQASLNQTSVTFGDRQAPILSANGPDSVTVQVPCEAAPGASVPVTITVLGTSKTGNVQVREVSPGIVETTVPDGKTRAVLVRQDGSFVEPSRNPARKGDIIRLYATGLGATVPPIPTGGVAVTGLDATVTGTVIVGVNNAGVRVVSAKAANNLVGVYEVAFEVPLDAPTGDVVLSLAINSASGGATVFSKGSTIPIQ